MNVNQEIARTYARHGVPTFPCREINSANGNVKGPYTRNGYHDASTNTCQFEIWKRSYPTAIYGLPCAPNGVIVLDADRHGNGDGVASLSAQAAIHGCKLSSYPLVQTPRGLHALFRRPAELGKTRGTLATAIDVRDNAYIIAPGTVLPDGRQYQLLNGTIGELADAIGKRTLPLLPNWLAALVVQPLLRVRTQVQTPTNPDILKKHIGGLVRAVVCAPEGNRNQTLFWASCRVGALVAKNVISEGAAIALLIEAGHQAGLTNSEAAATARSGLRRLGEEAGHGS